MNFEYELAEEAVKVPVSEKLVEAKASSWDESKYVDA